MLLFGLIYTISLFRQSNFIIISIMKHEHYEITPEKRNWYLLVNGLTFLRAMCGLSAVLAASQGNYILAAGLFGFGLATDLEGAIARAKKVSTQLGNLRDLMADNCLYIGGFISPIVIGISREAGKISSIPEIVPLLFGALTSYYIVDTAIYEHKRTMKEWKEEYGI